MAICWAQIVTGPSETAHHLHANHLHANLLHANLLLVRQDREQVRHRRTYNRLPQNQSKRQEDVSWDYLV